LTTVCRRTCKEIWKKNKPISTFGKISAELLKKVLIPGLEKFVE
jgi:hypothetical protein